MNSRKVLNAIKFKFELIKPELDERSRRLWAATEAEALGYGGVAAVSKATGIAESTIRIGKREIKAEKHGKTKREEKPERIRKKGGGRKRLTQKHDNLITRLDSLIEPLETEPSAASPLRWTCKSTRKLAQELSVQGYLISHTKIRHLLMDLNYELHSNKTLKNDKACHLSNAQFKLINDKVIEFQKKGQPVISLDIKKKELIGPFSDDSQKVPPCKKQTHKEEQKGENKEAQLKADDKGVTKDISGFNCACCMRNNQCWINLEVDDDTVQFSAHSLYQWWYMIGKNFYRTAEELLIVHDNGTEKSYQEYLWKKEFKNFADIAKLEVSISLFPPGTKKWSQIKHKMLSCIISDAPERHPICHEVTVNLIV